MKTLKLFTLLFFTISLVGCDLFGEAEEAVTNNSCAGLIAANERVQSASITYSSNPTSSNCLSFKSAIKSYIDIAAKCPTVSSSQIASLRSQYNDLCK